MPELPEVETFKRKIERALKGKKLSHVEVSPDDILFAKKKPAFIKKALLGAKVKKVGRKGKYFWLELDRKPWPVFHLGMTGSVMILEDLPERKIKFTKLILETEDGTVMVFKDPRRFGRILLLDEPFTSKPLSHLGADVKDELPTPAALGKLLEKRHAPIKAVLLDQGVLAGIGNWMADEILYQASIDPHRPASDLSKTEVRTLRNKIKLVTDKGVELAVKEKDYPESWLFHERWGKRDGLTFKGEQIETSIVGGRGTAWVPSKQK